MGTRWSDKLRFVLIDKFGFSIDLLQINNQSISYIILINRILYIYLEFLIFKF